MCNLHSESQGSHDYLIHLEIKPIFGFCYKKISRLTQNHNSAFWLLLLNKTPETSIKERSIITLRISNEVGPQSLLLTVVSKITKSSRVVSSLYVKPAFEVVISDHHLF